MVGGATCSMIIPSAQQLLPTGIIILGNYLEIGNSVMRCRSPEKLFPGIIWTGNCNEIGNGTFAR